MTIKTIISAILVFSALTSATAAEIKELRIGIGIDADTFNPQEQKTSLMGYICDLIYDTLFFKAADGKLEPRLATGWEMSPNGLLYTLHIRKGVKFSDGTPCDALALKYNFDRVIDPNVKMPLRFCVSMIDKVGVLNESTIMIKLKYAYSPFSEIFSSSVLSPIAPSCVKKFGENISPNPVGAGPYKLEKWIKGDRIVLVRNEKYYGETPSVARLVFKIVPDVFGREIMLRNGEIDICFKPMPPDIEALQSDPNITVKMPLSSRTIFMGFNCQKGPTANKEVRKAFNYAVDKKTIVNKILFGAAVPMEGPMSPVLFGYSKMGLQYDYNPERAKTMLKQANFDFTRTVHVRTPIGRYLFDKQISETVLAFLQAIGVKAELRSYDWPVYVADLLKPLNKSELEVFLLGWGPAVLDADLALYGQFHSSSNPPKGLGNTFYNNQIFDKLVETARREQDYSKRLDLYKKASEIVWDDCPWLWLHTEKFVIAYRSSLKNLIITNTEKIFPTYAKVE
jgi:peptide/nickel transport system substrate-binding protein